MICSLSTQHGRPWRASGNPRRGDLAKRLRVREQRLVRARIRRRAAAGVRGHAAHNLGTDFMRNCMRNCMTWGPDSGVALSEMCAAAVFYVGGPLCVVCGPRTDRRPLRCTEARARAWTETAR
eukprot:COSAG02_NODE_1060_length_14866_cov_3.131916_16_plen_123_part_00